MEQNEFTIEGRNAVIEAFRAGRTIDKLYVLDGCKDGPIMTIKREAAKQGSQIKYVAKERLDQMSETGRHQGVIASAAAYAYAGVDDILQRAKEKGETPFVLLLDGIEDPHNLGAIIRTANQAGAHGVIIPKNRAVGLTATVAKASAGALNYTPVAKVTNLGQTRSDAATDARIIDPSATAPATTTAAIPAIFSILLRFAFRRSELGISLSILLFVF